MNWNMGLDWRPTKMEKNLLPISKILVLIFVETHGFYKVSQKQKVESICLDVIKSEKITRQL